MRIVVDSGGGDYAVHSKPVAHRRRVLCHPHASHTDALVFVCSPLHGGQLHTFGACVSIVCDVDVRRQRIVVVSDVHARPERALNNGQA